MTGDAGRSDIPICIGRRPSNATSFGQRPSVFACHDITPRMTLGFRPLVLFFTLAVRAQSTWSAATEPTERDLKFDTELLRRLKWLNSIQETNQSRSHPPMSVTWNLVYDRARRIPVRVFKIHKRCMPAMKFTLVAVCQATIRTGVAVAPRSCSAQHVGLAGISTLKLLERAVRTAKYSKIYRLPKTPVIYAFLGSSFRFPVKSFSSQKKI